MTHHVHHVPGRLRIRIPELKRNPALARVVTEKVRRFDGIQTVEASVVTGSLLVFYDLGRTDFNTLCGALGVEGEPAPRRSIASESRLGGKIVNAVFWYALEKAIERSLPLVLGAL